MKNERIRSLKQISVIKLRATNRERKRTTNQVFTKKHKRRCEDDNRKNVNWLWKIFTHCDEQFSKTWRRNRTRKFSPSWVLVNSANHEWKIDQIVAQNRQKKNDTYRRSTRMEVLVSNKISSAFSSMWKLYTKISKMPTHRNIERGGRRASEEFFFVYIFSDDQWSELKWERTKTSNKNEHFNL